MTLQIVPFADIIDVEALLSVVGASLVAGAGLTLSFSALIVFATRAAELRRGGSHVASVVLGVLAALAGLGSVALIAFGLTVMLEK